MVAFRLIITAFVNMFRDYYPIIYLFAFILNTILDCFFTKRVPTI